MGKQKDNVEQAIETLKAMLATMSYGSITLVVQDHVVVQIEKNEKIRLK
ncbi:YezD family protein [Sporosarcina sp. FSL K6-3457]